MPHVVASRISLRTAATNDVVQAVQAVHQVVQVAMGGRLRPSRQQIHSQHVREAWEREPDVPCRADANRSGAHVLRLSRTPAWPGSP